MSDSKAVRRYVAGVERALGLFDASNEWADFIAFLSRLSKALQASPPDAEVPCKKLLAKYLALCLKPTLPSGVHQKALEIYGLVFALSGRDGLARDLPVWLPGISATLTFASLNTRPLFLSLYDDHILKLSSHTIRPALKAIILSLLPGIEEENSEDFDRTLSTFNQIRDILAQDDAEEFFWQSLFLASITSINRRPGVLVYLNRYLPRLGAPADPSQNGNSAQVSADRIRAVTTPEPGLLMRCFATALQDDQPLVQRGFLDLLVTHLPLNAGILQNHIPPKDLDVLVTSAMSVVLRRDMSLNRRLWSWFVGRDDKREGSTDMVPKLTSPTAETPVSPITTKMLPTQNRREYFASFGLTSVIRSLEKMLAKPSLSPVDRARPFRIMLSLLDREIIGRQPVEALFIPIMKDLQKYQTSAPSQTSFDEVFRSANVFFDAIEPQMIAKQLFLLLDARNLALVDFILSNFNLQEEDMTTIHIPALCLVITETLLGNESSDASDGEGTATSSLESELAKLLDDLLSLLPAQISNHRATSLAKVPTESWTNKLRQAYTEGHLAKVRIKDTLPSEILSQLLLRNAALILLDSFGYNSRRGVLDLFTTSLMKTIARAGGFEALTALKFGDRLNEIALSSQGGQEAQYQTTKTITRVVDTIHAFDPSWSSFTRHHALKLVPELISQFWSVLLPSTPQYHVEAVEQIWNLRSLSQELLLVDSTILELVIGQSDPSSITADALARFSTFWTHTRLPDTAADNVSDIITERDVPWILLKQPTLYLLDACNTHADDEPATVWLSGLPSIRPVLKLVLSEFTKSRSQRQHLMLGLNRIQKVVSLMHESPMQKGDFFNTAGLSSVVLDMCLEVIGSTATDGAAKKIALSILRLIIDGTDFSNSPGLIEVLVQLLQQVPQDGPLQENMLEILQGIFSKSTSLSPPNELMVTLIAGISSPGIDTTVDKWITLLCNTIPLYSTNYLFTSLLKLTDCFCKRIQDYFGLMQALYATNTANGGTTPVAKNPEKSINNLLAGLEYVLARAHTHLVEHAASTDTSNASNTEIAQSRAIANHRLTVILCMQDTIKVCGEIWAWRIVKRPTKGMPDAKSFNYMSSRLRTRARRILEHLADAEPQECLEALMGMWVDAARKSLQPEVLLNLMQSLDGARPKFMMPATFNAIYSRTNPTALDQSQKSSLSVDMTAVELMAFLIAYTDALEDDLLEEIWTDCTAFLREVLANPMPHRQLLLKLLEFVAVMCRKMENTNFGEVSKMRRELSDLCARLFTAIFTVKPGGLESTWRAPSDPPASEKPAKRQISLDSGNAIHILGSSLPVISAALGESDRLTTTFAGIAMHVTGPALRSKQFPQTMTPDLLTLIQLLAKSQPNSKVWKKDVLDAFNDARFFQSPLEVVEQGWLPLLKQMWLFDKTLMQEMLGRLTPPAAAGIMFGVGASAARTEADKRTQLNLRRIAFLLCATEQDVFLSDLVQLTRKLEELLEATPSSSPSSATRGDVYLLLRAIVLSFSQIHLASFWPMIDGEFRDLFERDEDQEDKTEYTAYSRLQGAKLLDFLLLTKPDEFQLHEWLFVTDTVDAIYPPPDFESRALADNIKTQGPSAAELSTTSENEARKPWLCDERTRTMEDPTVLLRPFFRNLSIHAFEDTYSLQAVDMQACRRDLLADLFAE